MPHTHDTNDRTSATSPLKRRLSLLLAVPLLVAVLAACQSNQGISSEDAAAIKDQIQQVASRLDAVEERLIDLSEASTDAPPTLISEVRAVTSDVGAAKTILDDVSNQLEVATPTPADDAVDGVGDTLDNAIDNAGDAINDGVDGVDNAIDNAGDAINDGLNDAGDAINDGLNNADDALDDAGGEIDEALPGVDDDAVRDPLTPGIDQDAPAQDLPGLDDDPADDNLP